MQARITRSKINSLSLKGGRFIIRSRMKKQIQTVLGIETSCDETACSIGAIDHNRVTILSNIISSSALLQSKYGGIIPEQAAREQIKAMVPVVKEALAEAKLTSEDLDAVAVTTGPGLIGSLLVGVETAKVLATIWQKPLIPVNHLIGHFYANWITSENNIPHFPCIGLLVSGGHSDLVLFKDHQTFEYLGGTRDDAAGECFDKCARLLNLPYPGGPQISKLAEKGNPRSFNLPRPLEDSLDFDFSFSGLKTAVSNLLDKTNVDKKNLPDLCASIEQAIIDSLIKKTLKATKLKGVDQIIVAGGVAANKKLIAELTTKAKAERIEVLAPPTIYCTDNAAMIVSAALFNFKEADPLQLQANPNLSLAY
jgi:N6-L-threonylcarbamoyladenine synthase